MDGVLTGQQRVVPKGTKVYPIMMSDYKAWVGKPKRLTADVQRTAYPLARIFYTYSRFIDHQKWSMIMFDNHVREKGQPKRVKVAGFIYPT